MNKGWKLIIFVDIVFEIAKSFIEIVLYQNSTPH